MTIKELKGMAIKQTRIIEIDCNVDKPYNVGVLMGILEVAHKMGKLWIYDEEENVVIEYNKRKGIWESIDKKAGY
jgi:hypothetical protein